MWDYIKYSGRIADVSRSALETLSSYIPNDFNWWIFGFGELFLVVAIFQYFRKENS
jgi:hypothetical protein